MSKYCGETHRDEQMEKEAGAICCKQCKVVIHANPTAAQKRFNQTLCDKCAQELLAFARRIEQQREAENQTVHCPKCMMQYRAIDLPDPKDCVGCKFEADRLRKLEERRKNPPMCTKCKEEEDADEPAYPGLCYRCLSRQMDEETELEEEAEEVERLREEAEYAAQKAAK